MIVVMRGDRYIRGRLHAAGFKLEVVHCMYKHLTQKSIELYLSTLINKT